MDPASSRRILFLARLQGNTCERKRWVLPVIDVPSLAQHLVPARVTAV
jgi:hypothetical protein